MALQTQNIDLRFVSGADTKTEKPNTLFSSFQEVKNGRIDKIGSIIPRGGFVNQARVNTSSNPSFSLTADGEYVVIGANSNLVIPNGANTVSIGKALRGGFKRTNAGDSSPSIFDMAYTIDSAGIPKICLAWLQTTGSITNIGVLVQNTNTDEILLQSTIAVAGVVDLRVAANGGEFFIFYENSSFDLVCRRVDQTSTSSPLTAALTWVAAPTASSSMIYAVTFDSARMYVAYTTDAAPTVTTIQSMVYNGVSTITGTVGGTTITSAGNVSNIALCPVTAVSGAAIAIGIGADSVGVKGAFFSSALAQVGSTQTGASATNLYQRMAIQETVGGVYQATITHQYKTANSELALRNWSFTTAGNSVSVTSGGTSRIALVSGLVKIDGNYYVLGDAYTDPTYGSQALMLYDDSVSPFLTATVGRFAVDKNVGQAVSGTLPQLTNPITVGNKVYFASTLASTISNIVPAEELATVTSTTITPFYQVSLLILDLTETSQTLIDRSNSQAMLFGPSPKIVGAYERPGIPFPELGTNKTDDLSVVAAGTLLAGVYSWVFAKVYKSATGAIYRQYSPIYTADLAANNTLQYILRTSDFEVPQLATVSSYKGIDIEIYRTLQNESVFYLSNTHTAASTYTDTTIDDVVATGRLADINGDELSPAAIPSTRAVAFWKDRVAFVDADEPNTIKFNRPAPAPAGSTWASGLEIALNGANDDVVALQQMDQALYIFKPNRILTLYGDPPGLTGQGGTLNTPQTVFNGVGCSDPRSVVLTSKGIMFKSDKGFYLIMRNQEIAFMGAGPYDDRTITVVGSGIGEDQAEVYFAHSNGSIWVFNTDLNAWYDWDYGSTLRGFAAPNGRLLALAEADYFEVLTTATQDDPFTGSNTAIATDVTTGWLRLDGIRGYQRIKRAYFQVNVLAACTMTLEVYTDYNDTTPVQTITVPSSALSPTTGNTEFDVHLKVQKSDALKFRLVTSAYGVKWLGATLVVGVKDGGSKTSSNSY